jgi:NAD(P)-dependent dehydrogenase (short-subunit alcohol dehydrogenase family)
MIRQPLTVIIAASHSESLGAFYNGQNVISVSFRSGIWIYVAQTLEAPLMKLNGQVAIILGSARGIGEAIAHTFAQEGASLVLVDLEKVKPQLDGVTQAINQTGGKAIAVAADCTDDGQVNALVDETMKRLGKIDILINSIGFRGPLVAVQDISEQEWDDVVRVNLKSAFLCFRAVLKVMTQQKSGSIVSISGTAGREGMALRGSLCAAKWGLLGLTQTIAKEAGPYGVRANVICPGGMDEPDLREMYAERAKGLGMEFSQLEKQVLELTPLRKYAKHIEVAKAALFLASSDSSHTTGESLNVSGGRLMS